jgi:NADH-quinone oxidoreductase B subunit
MTDMGVVDLPEPRIGPASRLAPKPIKFVLNWGRRYSLWVFNFGLACCAIEFIATSMSRHDFIRLGVIPFAPGPRQADLMVVSGTVSDKMAPAVKRLYDQMPEPKYVISFGACSNCGGPYWDSYCVTKGVDQIIPVDVYVPGCPPRPEALLHGIVRLQEKIAGESLGARYSSPEGVLPPPEVEPKPPTPAIFRRPLVLPPLPEPEEIEAAEETTQSLVIPDLDAVTESASVRTRELPPPEDEAVAESETVPELPVVDEVATAETQRLPAPEEIERAAETEPLRPVELTQPLPPAEEVRKVAEEREPRRRRGTRLWRFAEPPPVNALDDPDIIPGLRDDD